MTIPEAGIIIFSLVTVWALTSKPPRLALGYLFGILGEPFWLIDAYQKSAWHILFASIVFGYCWIRGMRNQRNQKGIILIKKETTYAREPGPTEIIKSYRNPFPPIRGKLIEPTRRKP